MVELTPIPTHLHPHQLTSTDRTAVAVSTGLHHTCAILDNGDLKCWGWDNYGQLGGGGTQHTTYTYTKAPSSTAIDLGTSRTAVAVSAGLHRTCAILDNGDAKCWGRQDVGQLGQGSSSSVGQTTPVLVAGSNIQQSEQRLKRRHDQLQRFTCTANWTIHGQQHVHN